MEVIKSSKRIIDRLLQNDYQGDNAESLRTMDLNELSSNMDKIGDAFEEVTEAANKVNNALCIK